MTTPRTYHEIIEALRAENERLREVLEIISGKRQCLDNLMSNQDIARAALQSKGDK
jgi:hypothetical protein